MKKTQKVETSVVSREGSVREMAEVLARLKLVEENIMKLNNGLDRVNRRLDHA